MAYLGNPKNTIEVLQKYNFNFQKKFGQNFLIDTGILEEIIDSAGITKDDMILEIGPGIGTMTQYLCESARQVIAVEIDTNLIPILKDTLSEYDNVKVINDDILKVDINALAEEYNNGKPIKVVCKPAILHNDTYYYGAVRESCADRQYYNYGAEGGRRPYAGRSRQEGLRSSVTCGAVLFAP